MSSYVGDIQRTKLSATNSLNTADNTMQSSIYAADDKLSITGRTSHIIDNSGNVISNMMTTDTMMLPREVLDNDTSQNIEEGGNDSPVMVMAANLSDVDIASVESGTSHGDGQDTAATLVC